MSRSRVLLLLASASLAACRRDEPLTPAAAAAPALASPLEWSASAPAGKVAIHQAPAGSGCLLTAVVEGATRWTADACAGSREDLPFVSPDGERLLVLYPLPERRAGSDWSEATVARIFVRGKEERRLAGAELVAAAAISDMSRRYSWLMGVGSASGSPPRYAAGGEAVVVELADGATRTLGFDGSGVPGRSAPPAAAPPVALPAPAAAAPARAPAAGPQDEAAKTMYRWEDDDGSVHFSFLEEIPRSHRKRATAVTASVGTVSRGRGDEGPWRAPAASSASPRAGAAPARSPGPRLNGLTDQERHEQELKRLEVERAKNLRDAELWQKQRERDRELDRARAEQRWPYR